MAAEHRRRKDGFSIFLNYRRDDSGGYSGRLYDALVGRYGDEHVFMDVDAIPLGVDFTKTITQHVAACDVFIAVLGRDWLSVAVTSINSLARDWSVPWASAGRSRTSVHSSYADHVRAGPRAITGTTTSPSNNPRAQPALARAAHRHTRG